MGTDWECECSEDYGACEDHRDVLAQREGASTRTADDLAFVFLCDVVDIMEDAGISGGGPDEQALRAAVDYWGENSRWNDSYGCRWVAEELTRDGIVIQEDIPKGESVLSNLGLVVDWEDGYVISRTHPDCPLLAD